MQKLLKLYGLPRTGTNLTNLLMSLNFVENVCTVNEHNFHYLGWKHSKPSDINVYNVLEKLTNTEFFFVFNKRNFENWKEAILNRHLGNWEFPLHSFSNEEDCFFYYTPCGYELYKNIEELYINYNSAYQSFCDKYPEKSIMIDFDELVNNQRSVIYRIKEKFNLTLSYNEPIEINKKVSMDERI